MCTPPGPGDCNQRRALGGSSCSAGEGGGEKWGSCQRVDSVWMNLGGWLRGHGGRKDDCLSASATYL